MISQSFDLRALSLRTLPAMLAAGFLSSFMIASSRASDTLELPGQEGPGEGKRIVLIAGDEEYRSEETMPMLAKILSQRHGFHCTVLFSFGPDGADYIDPNNQRGLRGLETLETADLVIIGTRFRRPSAEQAEHLTNYLNAGKPLIGYRTATHAFNGNGSFGDSIGYGEFGRKIFGEQWVSHHGAHKRQGARSVVEPDHADHPILKDVDTIDAPSDVYGVVHLTEENKILLRGAVTESLDPDAAVVDGPKNDPMQPLAWLHQYTSPNGEETGTTFCTTAGASVDFVDEDLRRLVVNAAYFLNGLAVPEKANVDFVDPFYPSFYGFINEKDYWKNANLRPADFGLGKSPTMPDPPGTPDWPHRPQPPQDGASTNADDVSANTENAAAAEGAYPLNKHQRIALVGNSTAERMNLFGHLETMLHSQFSDKQLLVRNFGWPADEVGNQQRPGNYTKIDDPLEVFDPDLFVCFFGFNESYAGTEPEALERFAKDYRAWIAKQTERFTSDGNAPRFVLVSPIAFEATENRLQPSGEQENRQLQAYANVVADVAQQDGHGHVGIFTETKQLFSEEPGAQFTINGIHLNEEGDRAVSQLIFGKLFGEPDDSHFDSTQYARLREAVNDKSWFHLQDYRMLNGWYVYGGRRTWDTETFPVEFGKIRNMVAVRDRYIWKLASGEPVPDQPDDSETGEVFIPETMFGSRDENFRRGREPETLEYPTPDESIAQMTMPAGFKVETFASEQDFPELANPTQINFDNQGRLWVSCMINYPQWLPGAAKPGDHLLILEDTNNDGKADDCTVFYDKLICPTGFEFWNGGVLVVDEPRILFLKDTTGDNKADEVIHLLDGIGTDDTHHAMGAWEFSHGGLLHMLEGVSMSTTLETPWGPFRNHGPSGAYVFDPITLKIRHFRTPAYGNPWCLVFDPWGNGIIGDGTGATHHWTTPLSGAAVSSRRTLRPIFDNEGMRPAVGNDFLYSRHFPDEVQGQFIYGCVINMHGFPRFNVRDEEQGAGLTGERIDDLLASTDMFFRPVDPKIGPDGALWFGDWCNALIGHMQYSQRDPNRDHEHGRIYRMVYEDRELLQPALQADRSVEALLEQLSEYEFRTRYRARRELRDRPRDEVLAAVDRWIEKSQDPQQWSEALWIQESFRSVDPKLLERIMQCDEYRARAAAVHTIGNEHERIDDVAGWLRRAIADEHPRVRVEAIRAASFLGTAEAAEIALVAAEKEVDYWIDYTLEHTLRALTPAIEKAEESGEFLVNAPASAVEAFRDFKYSTGPGKAIYGPLKTVVDPDKPETDRRQALDQLIRAGGGDAENGKVVFNRACAACHQAGDIGKEFGPTLTDVGSRLSKEELIRSIIWPNEKISKGFETLTILTDDGRTFSGFILEENEDEIMLGVADGKTESVPKETIELRVEKNASSMPEGLTETIAPIEFLDLLAFLTQGWISTSDADKKPLRSEGAFQEISRQAKIKLGEDFPTEWSQEAGFLLSGIAPKNFDFTFHSPHEVDQPAIIIRMDEEREVRRIWMQNRLNPEFHARAKGLTVWLSKDGENWTEAWHAEKPQAEWMAEFPEGTKASHIKIGLRGKGTFHLNQVAVFGE